MRRLHLVIWEFGALRDCCVSGRYRQTFLSKLKCQYDQCFHLRETMILLLDYFSVRAGISHRQQHTSNPYKSPVFWLMGQLLWGTLKWVSVLTFVNKVGGRKVFELSCQSGEFSNLRQAELRRPCWTRANPNRSGSGLWHVCELLACRSVSLCLLLHRVHTAPAPG